MRVLLTGATGFLGRRTLELLAAEHEPIALVRSADELPKGVEAVIHDLGEPLNRGALPRSVDSIVHLAQSRRFREFPAGAADVYAVNVRTTFELLLWAQEAGAARFVLTSTGGVYDPGHEPLRETDALRPRTDGSALANYVNSKQAAELLAASFARSLVTTVLRPFFVYGAGQDEMLVASLAGRIVAGRPITVAGDPGMRLNPIHVADAARAVVAAVEGHHPGTFNLAGERPVSLAELARLLIAAAGEGEIQHSDGSPKDLVADTSRMREVLEVTPRTGLEQGLGELLDWLRARAGGR